MSPKILFTILLSLLGLAASTQAQVTLRVPAVPAGTPAGAIIYVAGSFNSWNPASTSHALTRAADGAYEITLPAATGSMEYKFTRGSWATVESGAGSADVANRSFTFGAAAATLTHQIIGWKDLGGSTPPASTANANVQVMATVFAMPQLGGRTRRVWLYLPTGYAANAARRYPVLYLQDGQNVFDAATSFSGEWGVDETLTQLQGSGLSAGQCIVVAVDNGPARLDEYSPWRNEQYRAGGEGDQYLQFLVETLKPHIDANYRTEPGRESTGIGGSSLGALIATYAALKYPAVFGKVASFSPAYWFAEAPLFAYVRQHPARPDTRFYFVSGTTESPTMVPLMTAMREALLAGGVPAANLSLNTRPDGQHNEAFWRREFEAGFRFLYAAATPSPTRKRRGGGLGFELYPNPVGHTLRVALPAGSAGGQLAIRDLTGRLVLEAALRPGAPKVLDVRGLRQGQYFAQVQTGSAVDWRAFSKE